MVNRERLRQADKHARRRYRWIALFCAEPHGWVRYRKKTVPCSCWMCGNPRRYLGQRTVQEKRALEMAE